MPYIFKKKKQKIQNILLFQRGQKNNFQATKGKKVKKPFKIFYFFSIFFILFYFVLFCFVFLFGGGGAKKDFALARKII